MPKINSSQVQPFPRISIAEIEGIASSVRHRQQEFHHLHTSLLKAKSSIVEALRQDYSYTEHEADFEYLLALAELRQHYESINLESEKAAAYSIEQTTHSADRTSGVGIVYIIPEAHRNGFYAVISPLCAAMAAGNCVIIELQRTLSRTTTLLRSLLSDSLSHDTFAISDERVDTQFMSRCCVVSQSDLGAEGSLASANTLITCPPSSPATLFVDRTADLKLAARCTIAARFSFSGSSLCAPSAVFVHEAVEKAFSTHLLESLQTFLATQELSKEAPFQDRGLHKGKASPSQKETTEGEVLFSNANIEVVVVRDRSCHAHQPQPQTRSSRQRLILYSTTSSDDALNLASGINNDGKLPAGKRASPVVAMIYASPPHAQYIANSVDAIFTCVNTISTELLVGPMMPRGGSLSPRYSRAMFAEARPMLLEKGPLSFDLITASSNDSTQEFQTWKDLVEQPLKATGQRPGKRVDFFIQGLVVGSSIVSITLIFGFAILGKFAFKKLWGSRI